MKRSLFALFAILLLLCSCGNSGKLSTDAKFYGSLGIHNKGENVEITNGGAVVATIEDAKLARAKRSVDGKTAVIAINKSGLEEYERGFDGYSLFYFRNELIHIADGVHDFILSDNGDSVSYTANTDYEAMLRNLANISAGDFDSHETVLADLYVWNSGISTFIDKNSYLPGMEFSPDGKDFYYNPKFDDGENVTFDWYCYNGGEPVLAAKDTNIRWVSNNRELLYISTGEGYFIQKGLDGERIKLPEEINYFDFTFNADNSQLLLTADSGLYISADGSEPKLVSDRFSHFIVPNLKYVWKSDSKPVIDDFRGQYYLSETSIYKINDDFSVSEIVRGINNAFMSGDGETITFIGDDDTLATLHLNDDMQITEIDNDIDFENGRHHIIFSYDRKTIYYTADDNTKLYVLKNGKSKLLDWVIGDDEIDELFIYDNDKLYYTKGDIKTLYRTDGVTIRKIHTFPDNIAVVTTVFGALEVHIYDDYYYSFDGLNFTHYE
ncbi:MAG: hypothetical protein LBM41_04985 [Ruminococcus sp.]|jgi:hypothetical protein|nr:hypothetical protein [Ruminococcus sp.]